MYISICWKIAPQKLINSLLWLLYGVANADEDISTAKQTNCAFRLSQTIHRLKAVLRREYKKATESNRRQTPHTNRVSQTFDVYSMPVILLYHDTRTV